MIPVPKDPTDEPEAGSVPTVSGDDRIGSATPSHAGSGAPEVVSPGSHDPARLEPDRKVSAESDARDDAPVVGEADRTSHATDTSFVAAPPSPRQPATPAARSPDFAVTRDEPGDTVPIVRPAMPSMERPTMDRPSMERPRVEPTLDAGPNPGPVASVHPPMATSPADEPTMIMAPPRRSTPPPPPVDAMPPPPPPGTGRRPLTTGSDRIPVSAQHYPMPSTIAPVEPTRKRSTFRSKAARSSVVVVFDGMMSLATVVALVLWVLAFAGLHEFELPGPLQATKVVIIPPKKSREEIGDILEANGVVSSGTVFVYGSIIDGIGDLKAGEYEFHSGESMHDIADEIQQNKVVQHKITFPEGWTSEQIVQRLVDDPVLTGKIVAIPEEGSLLPETYTYPRGETRQQILDIMRKTRDRRLTEIWAHRNAEALKQLKVPEDLVTLASIVEKETSKPDERARIAGVFVNRLNRNMRLETDPTILYGLYGGKAWTESRTLTRADLAAPNPYNTYKIIGLPPGPIANPGRASLEAAANPAQTNELYFVADGTGGHAFADTLDEHNRNVAKWREIERQRKLADPTSAAGPATTGSGTGVLALPTTTPGVPPTPTRQGGTQRPRPRVTVPTDPPAVQN